MDGESHVAAIQYAQMEANHAIYRGRHLHLVELNADSLISDVRLFLDDPAWAQRFAARFSEANERGSTS